jgi:hypothetical protein
VSFATLECGVLLLRSTPLTGDLEITVEDVQSADFVRKDKDLARCVISIGHKGVRS